MILVASCDAFCMLGSAWSDSLYLSATLCQPPSQMRHRCWIGPTGSEVVGLWLKLGCGPAGIPNYCSALFLKALSFESEERWQFLARKSLSFRDRMRPS